MEAARESDVTEARSGQSVNMGAVHLDELPTYQDSGHDELAPQSAQPEPLSRPQIQQEDLASSFKEMVEGRAPAQTQNASSTDVPPGYEKTQQQSIQ